MQSEEWRGRILSQIMDNAVKYGNGEGITVDLNKEEEGFFLSLRIRVKFPQKRSAPTSLTVSGADRMPGI